MTILCIFSLLVYLVWMVRWDVTNFVHFLLVAYLQVDVVLRPLEVLEVAYDMLRYFTEDWEYART